jgi:protein SCO1/2
LICAILAFAWPTGGGAQSEIEEYPPIEPLTYGGPFSLIDHSGRPVTDEDFRGEYMLLTFGYTYCPDVCPTGLQNMALALDILGKAGERVRPIFITIDPKRDTVETPADYVPVFHPRLVGLTGAPRQVHEAAKAYLVHYTTVEYKGEYLVSHTASTYLAGPDGRFLKEFAYGTDPEEMAAAILRFMRAERATADGAKAG